MIDENTKKMICAVEIGNTIFLLVLTAIVWSCAYTSGYNKAVKDCVVAIRNTEKEAK